MHMAAIVASGALRDDPAVDPAIVKLLRNRYGAGLVYLRGSEERTLYQRAVSLGFVDREGDLTAAGRSLLELRTAD